MNLYLLTQTVNTDYDTYDSAVVAAENATDAATIHPNGSVCEDNPDYYSSWCPRRDVKVVFIGKAVETIIERSVICASYNAG